MSGGYNLGTAAGRITVDASGAKKGFAVAQVAADSFISSVNKKTGEVTQLGKKLTAASAAGVVGFGFAVNAASKFEARLGAVKAVSGATKDEMDQISEAALRIGGATSFGAQDAAQAFEELVKAGISVEDALGGAADATVKMAEAGEIDLPRAAEIAASAMNNFNLEAKELPGIADVIAGAANSSAITVEDFAQAMNQSGAVAAVVGMDFDDMAIAIAELGNAGIKGSSAGTALKSMLLRLQPAAKKQKDEFKRLGLETLDVSKSMKFLKDKGITPAGKSAEKLNPQLEKVTEGMTGLKVGTEANAKATDKMMRNQGLLDNAFFDSEGKIKSLGDIQDELQKSTKGMSDQQRLASFRILFGANAIRAAAVFSKEGAAGYDELKESIMGVDAADVAKDRIDNLVGAITLFKSAVETISIRIGTVLIPALTMIVKSVTAVLNFISTLSQGFYDWATGIGVAATAASMMAGGLILLISSMGPLLFSIIALRRGFAVFQLLRGAAVAAAAGPNMLAKAFTFMKIVVKGLAAALIPFYGTLKKIPLLAGLAAKGIGLIRIAMSLLMKAIPIVGILLTLAAVGKLLYDNFKPFRDLVDNIAQFFVGVFNDALVGAENAFRALMQGLVSGTGVMTGLQGVMNTIGKGVRALVEAFVSGETGADGFMGVMQNIGAVLGTLWEGLKELGSYLGEVFVGIWAQLVEVFETSLKPALMELAAVFTESVWPAVQQLAAVVMDTLLPALLQIWEAIQPLFAVIFELAGVIGGALFSVLGMLASLIFGTVIPALIEVAGPVLGFLLEAIANVAVWITTYLLTPFIEFVTFLSGFLAPAIEILGTVFEFVFGIILAVVMSVIDNVIGVFEGLVQFFQGVIEIVKGIFTGQWGMVWEGVKNVFFGAVKAIWNLAQLWIMGKLVKVVGLGLKLVARLFKTIWTAIRGSVKRILGAIFNFIKSIFGKIKSVTSSIWNGIKGFFIRVLTAIFRKVSTIFMRMFNKVRSVVSLIRSKITAVWNKIKSITSSVWNGIKSLFIRVVTAIWRKVSTSFMQILNKVRSVMTGMKTKISAVWNLIKTVFARGVAIIKSKMANGFRNAINAAKRIFSGLLGKLKGVWSTVAAWFRSIPGKVKGFFSGAGKWLLNAGKNILNGLKDGISNAWQGVKNKLKDLTSKIPDWKGPAPVDKKLLIPAGEMIMDSLRRGLQNGIKEVYDLLQGVTGDIPLNVKGSYNPGKIAAQISGMPINATQILRQEKTDPENLRPIQVTIEGVDTNNADEVAGKIVTSIKRFQRGAGVYAESR